MSNNSKNKKNKSSNNVKTYTNQEVKQSTKTTSNVEKKHESKKISKESIIRLIIFGVYAVLLIILACHHEPWRDEAQSWLLAKNLNFIDIFDQLKYEGHPFLWYYLLKIFNIFNLKYQYITVIPVILNLITTYIILRKSKLNTLANITIIFSSGLFFYCGIIARSYSLAYLLVILLTFMYKDRYQKPIYYAVLLFLLMNTHILLLGFVGSLVLIDIYEFFKKKENLKSTLIGASSFVVGLITLVLQFVNTIGSTGKTIHFEYLKDIFSATKNLLYNCMISDFLYAIFIIVMIVYVIYLVVKKEYKNLFIISCGILFQILFATMIYNSVNAANLVFMNILFVIFQSSKINSFINTITILIFSTTLYGTYIFMDSDIKYLFSDSKNIANYIEKNVEKGNNIYCDLLDYCAAINAYLPDNKYHFIDYNTDNEYTYTRYGDYLKVLGTQSIDNEFFTNKEMSYYIGHISNKDILNNLSGSEKYDLIYETQNDIFYSNETYVMYKHK